MQRNMQPTFKLLSFMQKRERRLAAWPVHAYSPPCSRVLPTPSKLTPRRSQALLADHTRAEADLALVPRGKLTGREPLVAAVQLHVRAPHRVEGHFG